ncbi:hypothetical protein MNB_SV-15-507 [hydrothermal vent metagenome]|uniref:Uncharacterized protein n=1 Tax=hydrothermal vent metagenome TaxID=652676 RepID=A0A1W1EJ36_9ZZZZ
MKYKPTILYVEDEEGIRNNVKRPLEYFSSKLFIACDGIEGLELYKKYNPDIVITDINMPHMNGLEMAEAIKKIKPKQYILITTAYNENKFLMDAIDMHIDSYILKPIDLELLENIIETITETINTKKELLIQQTLIQEISQLQNNCLIVFDKDEKIIFSNKKFLEFNDVSNIDDFIKKHKSLSSLLRKGKNYFYPNISNGKSCLEELKKINNNDNILISMLDKNNNPQTFIIFITYIKETKHTIISCSEVTAMESQKIEFEKKAYTDILTNIYNRTYFEQKFQEEINLHRMSNSFLSFIILDIDKFKDINDTYGHQMGDNILKDLAKIINSNKRELDTFARWGGEEFVLILEHTNIKYAQIIANKLRNIIKTHNFKNNISITCSFGVAELKPDDTHESIIRRADQALYRAKENGRNRVEI